MKRAWLGPLGVALWVGMWVAASAPGCTRDGFCIDCDEPDGGDGTGDGGEIGRAHV